MSATITRKDLEAKIVGRAWKDANFRREFVANPKATIEKYAEQKLPGDLKIFVHEEDASSLHITIPAKPAQMSELSDNDLEKVAGGIDVTITAAVIGLTAATAAAGISVANDQTQRRHGW